MKKIFAAIISLAMCAAMLTACGNDAGTTEVSDVTTTVSEAVKETEKETEAETTEAEATEAETTAAETEAETTAAETEAETEAEKKAEIASYASIEEFANSGDAFDSKSFVTDAVAAKDSLTYNWIRIFEGADGIYMDVEAIDGSITMIMGMKNNNIYVKMYEASSKTEMTILFADSKMYMLDEATKSGYYMTSDESTMEEYNIEALLGEIDFDAETENAADVLVSKVEIDGVVYSFEIAETGGGFLFDKNNELVAIITNDTDAEFNGLKVNEFSGSAPDSLFEVPSGYQLIDLEAALAE